MRSLVGARILTFGPLRSAIDSGPPCRAGCSNDFSRKGRRIIHDFRASVLRDERLACRRETPPPAMLNDATRARIIAAANARIDPRETAAALGWSVGKLLRIEAKMGLVITITIEG